MTDCPKELKYTQYHEWVRREPDDTYVVGITDYAQSQLGELVSIQLPDLEDELHAGDEAAVIESVKSTSDIYMPISGEIVEVNEEIEDSPTLVNSDPYGDGWLFVIKPSDEQEYDDLMSDEDYLSFIEE